MNPFIDLIEDGIENCYLEWGSLIEEYIQRLENPNSPTFKDDLNRLYYLDCIGSQFLQHGNKNEITEPYVRERVTIADKLLTKYKSS